MSDSIQIPGGNFFRFIAHSPDSVCCEDALLATALLSVGVTEHPRLPFTALVEDGHRVWQWVFTEKSADGKYETAKLIEWWRSPEWHAANPTHEFAIVARILRNQGEVARRIRETPQTVVIRNGDLEAQIPANASPAFREHVVAKLEGRIPLNAKFVEATP